MCLRAAQRVFGTRRGAPFREALFWFCGGDSKLTIQVIRDGCAWTSFVYIACDNVAANVYRIYVPDMRKYPLSEPLVFTRM